MVKQLKLKIIFALLIVGIVMLSGGLFAFNTHAQTKTTAQVSAETFYMEKGASVRLVEDSSGIRFKANITKGAYDSILSTYPTADGYTYRVYTKIAPQNNNTATPKIIEHSKGFEFKDDATSDSLATVNAAIVYDNLADNLKEAAYKTVLTAQTFIEVSKEGNGVVKSYEANVPAGNARSMRAVTNVEKLAGNEDALLNAYIGDYAVEESGAILNTFSDKGTVTLPIGVTPESVHIGAEWVEFSVDNGNSLINFTCDKEYDGTTYVAIFDANGNVYNYKADVENCAYINADNCKDETYGLFAAIEANVDIVLETDIDMTGMARTKTGSTYDKVFDGNGKTISNLSSVTNGNGGLFYTFGGTLKDVVIECVQLGSANINTGIIAYDNNYLDVTIENMYVEVGTATIGNIGQAGLFIRTQQNTNHGKITATNLVINYVGEITKGTTNYFGYLCAFGNAFAGGEGQFALNNCYFLNGGEHDIALFVEREGWVTRITPDSTYTVYNNGNASMNSYKVKKYAAFNSMMNDALTASMEEGFTVTEINRENYKDETNGLYASISANKNILLTSDLDMTGIVPSATGSYTAVFDGNECNISNLLHNAYTKGGLFQDFAGYCYNIYMTNVTLGDWLHTNGAVGLIAFRWLSGKIMSNIFIEVTTLKSTAAGAIACVAWSKNDVRNAIIIMPTPVAGTHYTASLGIPGAAFGCTSSTVQTSNFTNCYFVGNKNVVGWRNGSSYNTEVNVGISTTSSYKTYDAVSNLTADTTKTLTPFLTKCLSAING